MSNPVEELAVARVHAAQLGRDIDVQLERLGKGGEGELAALAELSEILSDIAEIMKARPRYTSTL